MNILQVENITSSELMKMIEKVVVSQLSVIQDKKKSKEKLLTRVEVASLLKISLVTLNAWSKKGHLPYYRLGNRIYYKESEIEASLKAVGIYKRQAR